MANQSIYAAFDRMWQHLLAKLNNFVSNDKLANSLLGLATETYVDNKVASLVDSAPGTLDTLNELAQALGDDPNFATTVATQIGNKVDKVNGKGLSTNDYTTEEKTKLAGIPADISTQLNNLANEVDAIDWFKTGIKIPANSDLDTYMTPGKYYCNSTSDSKTLVNSPVASDNFALFVMARTSSNTASLTQIIITLNGMLYIRGCSSDSSWRAWHKFADEQFFSQDTEPTDAVNGDFWIDTSEDTYAQKKIYESYTEPSSSQDGDLWIDTSDLLV